jgi:predicted Zn-dependent protease
VYLQREEARSFEGLRAPPILVDAERWGVWLIDRDGRAGFGVGARAHEALETALAARTDVGAPTVGAFPGTMSRRAAIGIEDPRLAMLSDTDRLEVLAGVERSLGPHRRRALRYDERLVRRCFWSTRGEPLEETGTVFTLEAAVQVGADTLSQRVVARRFADVASRPLGLELRRRADVAQRPVPRVSGRPIGMEPRVFAGVVDALARTMAKDPTRPARTAPAPEGLAILDDGSLPHALRTRSFDARGAAPRPVPLVHVGRWGEGYVSTETSLLTGRPRTGHEEIVGVMPANLVVRPGARTRNMLAQSLGKWVAVDSLPSSGVDAGRMRGPVRFVVMEGQERLGCFVEAVDVSLECLMSQLVELGSDEERHAHVDACTAIFSAEAFAPRPAAQGE